MAENFEPYHIPQQNRRNKLRNTQEQDQEFTIMNSFQENPYQGLSLSLKQCNNGGFDGNGVRNFVPLGPFTGYASILKNSRFLKPTQLVFDDVFGSVNCQDLKFSSDCFGEDEGLQENVGLSDVLEHQWRNSKLMLMLDEVYRRYKLYFQQMQSVVESFETVAGLGNAAPYICYAIKIVSKHFSCLKNALLDQLHFKGKISDDGSKKVRFRAADEQCSIQNQNPTLNFGFLQHPVWRSQRGLPDHAVAVLKTWLFEHFLHPYPTDSEKQTLAQQTCLSRTQVSNWFINARVRLWKPMVEEVYKLASQQAPVPIEARTRDPNEVASFPMEKLHWTSYQQKADNNNVRTKRSRNELANIPMQIQEQRSVAFDNSARHYQTGISGSVSLALGLHQNNGIDLVRPTPINLAQHVNLEMISMMGSASAVNFHTQHQH
ncbi:BEL1-like homeodomain protein 9 [Mercurialis annua]|uniref:BEL1-like homeodomain protein 9 n=1 Tax=Mercurialis annua TaxID=3986 RepID=UPI002160F445|nr:BEL1-like homeodomain protein 9 [Mercurialis annua]